MEPTTPLKAKSPDEAYPLEPFLAPGLPAGTMIGAGSTDPQYQPGTPEYALRSNDQFKAVNRTLFDTFEKVELAASPNDAAAILDRKDESAKNPVIRSFINNVKTVLPEGSNSSDAAWYVLNTLRPQVKHDAKYVFGKIRPIIQAKMDEADKAGSSFYPADMTNEDILGLAKQAGVDPSVIARMVGEEGELNARKATKTYTMGVLRPMVDMLDINSMFGQQVYNDPIRELAGLPRPLQRKAFLAMARWKEYHGESFLGGMVEGISTLIVDAGYAAGGFVEGSVGALTTFGSEGQYLMESGKVVLSDSWIQKPKEYQDEANSVLLRAHELAKKYGPELASAAGDEEKFAATLEGRFGQYGDKEEIRTFRRLSELRAEGAYRNQLSVERLANFGEGVLNAVPNMVKLFNSSIDPNSVFFRAEDNIKNNPLSSYFTLQAYGVNSVFAPAYEGWVKGTKHYQEMQGERLDKSIDLFLENYRDMQGDGESVVGFFYRKQAEGIEATIGKGVLSEFYRGGQKAAGGMLQEKELIQAAALADPVMTVLGTLKLLGVGAKAATAQKALSGVRAGLQEVTAEAVALRASANTTSKVFDTAVAELRVQLEAALPGAKFTDDDIIGIAIGDRKSIIGKSASAQVVRKEIGGTIAKNKSLAKRVGDLTKQLDELPDDVAGIEKLRARPVGGSVITASGYTAQGVSVPFNAVANFLDVEASTAKGFTVRRFLGTASRKVLSGPVVGSAAASALVGAYLAGGEFATAALFGLSAGAGTSTVGWLIRPDTLRLIGGKMAQAGRLQRAIGDNISKGQQYGESTFLRSAMDMEVEARKLFATVPMMKGAVRTAKQEADLARATLLADDAQQLRRLHKSGIEDVMMTASRVAWEDGLIAGGTGFLIAGLNDNDATGAGAGMAIGFSTIFRGLNRLHQVTPKGADPVHARIILGDVATIAQQVKDPVQRANMLAFLGDAGADSAAYIRRAGIVRDLYVSTRGQVKFVRGTEFEAATILTGSPDVEANMVQNEAAGIHPGDPAKAKAYAEERLAKLKASREAKDRATHLKTKVEENKVNIDNLNRSMAAVDADIAKQQAIVDDEKVNFTDIKKADANKIQLDKLLQRKSELQANLEVAANQSTVLEGDYNAALGESKSDIPFRPYESRLMPDGSTARSVASGFYVIDGPQGRSVTVNIDSIDNIAAVSEGMHALLADSAAESLMPEMVRMLFDETGDQSSGRAVSPGVTDAIIQAYGDSLTPAQRAKFLAEYRNGLDIYEKSGKNKYARNDISAIVEPLREAMTWMLASVDMSKRPGYRPDLASVASGRTNMASATGWDAVRKTLFGNRTLSDNVNTALKNMFDPVYGSLTRKNAAHIVSQLEASGMRFVESGDGTLRGYFLNENNEIVRSAVLDAFYDKLIVKTGGEGSALIRPINLYDPMIPVEQRIDFIKRNGLDWVLDDKGGIMTPEQIGVKSDGFIRSIEDGLNAIPEGERGMQVYTDEKGNVIRTGVPTQIEIAAIANNPNVPQSYKDNLLTVMKTIGSGEIKSVLSAEYSNIFSVNTEALTAHRLRVGKDIAGKTETRNIIPLAFTMGEAPIYGADGRAVKIKDPVTGKMVEAKQRVIRLRAFDAQAFQRSVNQSFSGGLYVLDDAGKRSFLKDPEGKEYTATYLRSLFGTDADFHNAAGLWMQHYQRAGALDPTAGVPMKDGSPRENNPVSAEVLDPINPVRGAAMRDALRVIFQLESGKKRLGWVEANRQTNTANGFAIRGTNFPISDFRLDQFGPLKENGQSMPIDLVGVTSGEFAMGVKGWGSHKPQIINGVPGMVVKTVFEAGENKFLGGNDINVTEVRVHPSLPDVKVFLGYEVAAGTNQKRKSIGYTIGDGKIINSNSSDMRLVMQEIKRKIYGREDANYIDSILNQWRYDSQKPLPGTLAAPAATEAAPAAGGGIDVKPVSIPYTTKTQAGVGQPVQTQSGTADIIRFGNPGDDRLAVVRNINGVNVPFYLSTGKGGKTDVPAGKWYPFFGFSEGGWINKTGGNEMVNYQGSQALRSVAEGLDSTIGDIRGDTGKYTKAPFSGLSFLNEGLNPVNYDTPNATELVKANIKSVLDRIEAGKPKPAAAEQGAAQGRDVTPRAGGPGDETTGRTPAISPKEQASQFTEGTGRDVPYMTPEEIARTSEFRVGPDGKITRITEGEKTERQRWQERYKAILNKRKEEAAQAKDTLNENEKKRRAMVNQVRDRAAAEIDAIEKRAAYWRSQAQKQAQADAKAAKAAQKEADQLQAQADARRIAFERGIGDARATADAKNATTNKLIDIALSSNQPLIAPGLLLVDANRLTVQPFRMALPTDTAVTPSATTRTGILYLRNVSGFESNIQAFQQSFFNYLHGEAIGRGQAIAGEAFRGPMAAQQGINLINTRMWVAEKSGGRLLREYRNADKASGRDIVTYKVYGANGMLIKQSNDAADAVEAINNLEERFMNTAGIGVLKPDALESAGLMLDAYTSKPATGRPKAKVQKTEEDTMRIQNLERYRGVEAAR